MTRTVDFRYMTIKNGADFREIYPAENAAPVIRMSDEAEIKTSFSGTFLQDPAIDWFSVEIRPELILDGVTYPLGIYAVAECTETKSETEKTVNFECYDRCWRVRDTCAETPVYFAAGTNYLDAVESLLTAAGISMIAKTASAATLAEARQDWETGTGYLEIINQLLDEINYNPLWFNASGAAVLEPASVPTAANIDHTFDTGDIRSLMLPQIQRDTDLYSAANVFLCICSNADKSAAMTASAENTNPQSPLSIPRRGRRIMKVVRVDNIADQAELQAYADRMRNESMISGETIQISTALLPGFGVADVTGIRTAELSAICIEREWEMQLTVGGNMRHTLERVVVNLG